MPTIGANGTPFRGAADVAFRPREFTGTITDDWTTVPWCATDFAPYDNTATDHLIAVHNPATGIGDICRYMGVIDSANWRMPTASEIAELYGSDQLNGGKARRIDNNSDWSDGLFAPLHGYAFGPHQSIVTIVSDIEVSNADPYDDGAVFLPASGSSNLGDGSVQWIGSGGFYWSSTGSIGTNGYYMSFNSSSVWPQYSDVRAYGFGVRCIRE